MGLFSKKKKQDPAYQGAQQAALATMQWMGNQKLPALPVIPQAATPNVNVPSSLPSYLGGGAGTVFPAGMPNQLSMIANQLSAGGYGAPDMSMYRSQTVAPTPPPVPVAPAPPAAPAAPAPAPVAAAPAPAPAPAVVPIVKRPMGFTGTSYGQGYFQGFNKPRIPYR